MVDIDDFDDSDDLDDWPEMECDSCQESQSNCVCSLTKCNHCGVQPNGMHPMCTCELWPESWD